MDHVENTVHSRMLSVSAEKRSRHPATGYVTPFIKNPLPQQRASFRDRYPAAGLHATISVQEVIGSNLSQDIQYSEVCRVFPQHLQRGWNTISIILDHFLSNPCQNILPFDATV
jgi:hypothetical protein